MPDGSEYCLVPEDELPTRYGYATQYLTEKDHHTMKELTLDLAEGIDDGKFRGRIAARGIICRNGRYLVITGKYGDCNFPGGGMEQGESLQETLVREVREETGYHVNPDSIRDAFLVHERRKGQQYETILIMDSYYYFCEVEDVPGEAHLTEAEQEKGYRSTWLSLTEMLSRNERIQDLSGTPWVVREKLVIKELLSKQM